MPTPEQDCRDFARQHPTPQVLRAIQLCEEEVLDWGSVWELFRKALAASLESVR